MKTEDFAKKISAILNELESKINDRPTHKEYKHTLKNLDEKFEKMNKSNEI